MALKLLNGGACHEWSECVKPGVMGGSACVLYIRCVSIATDCINTPLLPYTLVSVSLELSKPSRMEGWHPFGNDAEKEMQIHLVTGP